MNKIYYADINKETNMINGFYVEEIHGENIPKECIAITEELWQHLLTLGQVEVNVEMLANVPVTLEGETVYGMTEAEAFTKHIHPVVLSVEQTLEDRITELERIVGELISK